MLAKHDVDTREFDGWLKSDANFPLITANISSLEEQNQGVKARLDVEIAIDEKHIIIESFADNGDSTDDAIKRNLKNFADSSLHVILSSLWKLPQGEQVAIEAWRDSQNQWDAHTGPFVRKKSVNDDDVLPPEELLDTVQRMVSKLSLSPNLHWLRLYYANVWDEEPIIELLLDNETWADAELEITKLDWPKLNQFYSIRLFVILVPKNAG